MEHQPTKSQGAKNQDLTFQSLSSGIGLGALKPSAEGSPKGKSKTHMPERIAEKNPRDAFQRSARESYPEASPEKDGGKAHGFIPSGIAQPARSSGKPPSPAPSPGLSGLSSAATLMTPLGAPADRGIAPKRRFGFGPRAFRFLIVRFMLTFGIDLLFVAISVFVITSASTLVQYLRAGRGTPIYELLPLAWIMSQSGVRLLAGFFAVYLVYVVAFLVCAGATLGSLAARPSVHGQK